jgi:hypothetical protein
MTLFDRILLWRYRAGAINRRELSVLRRGMSAYRLAYQNGGEYPELPRPMLRKLRTVWIWSAHKVFVESPGLFLAGVVFFIPAVAITTFNFASRFVKWIGY